MELSRWGLDKISRLSDRYRGLRGFLADVLEGERDLLGPEEGTAAASRAAGTPFEVRNDIESAISGLRGRAAGVAGARDLLARLAPFFEAGFCLSSAPNGTHKLEAMFLFSRVFKPLPGEEPTVEIPLPAPAPDTIYRGRVQPVLASFDLDRLSSLREASAFALSVAPGLVFILICNRPHLWQLEMLERAHVVIATAIGKGSAR